MLKLESLLACSFDASKEADDTVHIRLFPFSNCCYESVTTQTGVGGRVKGQPARQAWPRRLP